MSSQRPLIALIFGSLSDYEVAKPGVDLIESWGVPYEITVASAQRTPDRVADWAAEAERRGVQAIIAAAGMAAHLPGLVAAHTLLPVIGLPIAAGAMQGEDALISMAQMPPGTPVATVAINGAANAAILALQILARADARWREPLKKHRLQMPEKIDRQIAQLKLDRPMAIWSDLSGDDAAPTPPPFAAPTTITPRASAPPPAPSPEPPPPQTFSPPQPIAPHSAPKPPESQSFSRLREPSSSAPPTSGASDPIFLPGQPRRPTLPPFGAAQRKRSTYVGIVRIASEFLPVDIVEQAVDCLLEGGILAIPTDTVYGLAVDATHKEAVQRLYALKERAPERAMAIFIDSQKALASLALAAPPQAKSMLEAFWPGPLTVVFERKGHAFDYLGGGTTIGVRLPDHSVPLTLMQELHRPLACTSANPGGKPEAKSAEDIERYFGQSIDMILDLGPLPERPASTVIDATQTPFRVIREGAITRAQLAAVVGDIIQKD